MTDADEEWNLRSVSQKQMAILCERIPLLLQTKCSPDDKGFFDVPSNIDAQH